MTKPVLVYKLAWIHVFLGSILLVAPLSICRLALGADEVGTAHPLVFQAAAPDGSWVFVCQAREDTNLDGKISVEVGFHGEVMGDRMTPYFIVGTGPGQKVDDFISSDSKGRYALVIREEKLILIDTVSKSEINLSALGADIRDDGNPFGPHRAGSFDAKGGQLLYLRRKAARTVAVVRELASAREIEIDPGPGDLWRASFAPNSDDWLVLSVIAKDTDGNGRLEWPQQRTTMSARRCRASASAFSTAGSSGDTPETRIVPVKGGIARSAPGFAGVLRDSILRRDPSGSIVMERLSGETKELIPAACGAVILHADAQRGLVLSFCAKGARFAGEFAPLELRDLDGKISVLGSIRLVGDVAMTTIGNRARSWDRFFSVSVEHGPTVIDLDGRTQRALESGDQIISVYGNRLLYVSGVSGSSLNLMDLLTGERRVLLPSVERSTTSIRAGSVVSYGPLVIDLSRGNIIGKITGAPLAVAAPGRVLVFDNSTPERSQAGVQKGPLFWRTPSPLEK